ncbi:PREDICTED: uncharacterized protein LOC109484728 isoform X2 [Branchiostoma belcheri]|uniref:Uncharacterized protein LOC109484728 isoform X2 n=1 Tax=Branchiostoma belcheri TaxID=7741 RepID=A0A6P5AKN7_BRABE|nr:PREDICTED: uncharacterized protein LOC109484728 isoform X2 [Branchiostoma belcheri]
MEGRCFLFLLFLLVPALTQDSPCPDGWVDIDDCCYYFSEDKVSYSAAKYECEEYLDGDLVAFDDCDEMEQITSIGEPCPYWVHPTTDLDCLGEEPEYENKYICKIDKETDCEAYCGGSCWEEGAIGCAWPFGSRSNDPRCSCPDGYFCCVPTNGTTCVGHCPGGECIDPDPNMANGGCTGVWKDPEECSCPYDQRCCCPQVTECENYCYGMCKYYYEECTGDYEWVSDGASCSCEGDKRCCVPKTPSCRTSCEGKCIDEDDPCDGQWMDPDLCPCPDFGRCCCKNDTSTTEPPPTECPMTDPPLSTDEHGCGLPEVASIPDDKVFDFEGMYETLTYAESDEDAADTKFDQVKEEFEKLSYKDGDTLSSMSGDLTEAVRAERDAWVLQYTDPDTGFEISIMLPGFDPRTGVLPEDLDLSGLSVSVEFRARLDLLRQRYLALRLSVNIQAFLPDCDLIIEVELNVYFRLVRVPLVLITCVTIECEAIIIVPVICYTQTWYWVGEPYCDWYLVTRCYVKYLIIHLTWWVRVWWITAFPPWAIQPLPECPDPDLGAIAPYEGFNRRFLDMAMDNFRSRISDDMSTELRVDEFSFVYEAELQDRDNTALLDMDGSVTDAVNGARDMWILTFRESEGDMETSILLENFDPTVDELPDEYELGDLSAFGAYSQRYLLLFSQRYREMRASVSLRLIFPTDCGPGFFSLQLNARFTLRRLPFFLLACWEIEFTEFLIVPVPCFEIWIICGIKVVIPVIKVIIIRRTYWFGLWVFIPRPDCPWPPPAKPGSCIEMGFPTGRNNGDIVRYECKPGFQRCKGRETLVCWKGQWRPQGNQLECGPACPPHPPAGYGAYRVRCVRTNANWLGAKENCVYRCYRGWVRWTGSYNRICRRGVWTGSQLVCFPPWNRPVFPHDCQDIKNMDPSLDSGIYMIYPSGPEPGFLVYCDMETDGGGWTVIQRRQDGSVDFYRDWDDYKHGFPADNMTGEFWLGNDKIHRLTVQRNYALRVDLEADDGDTAYAEYSWFGVNFDGDNYRATIAGYSGTAGDSMLSTTAGLSLNGMEFSTYDDDNDNEADGSCAVRFHGAWWYNACGESNLNGEYGGTDFGKGVVWNSFRGMRESLKFTEMKVRPVT